MFVSNYLSKKEKITVVNNTNNHEETFDKNKTLDSFFIVITFSCRKMKTNDRIMFLLIVALLR